MSAKPALQPGTGWRESYLGGSLEQEEKLFAQEVFPRIAVIQSAVAARQSASVRRALHNRGDPVRVVFEAADDLPPHLQVGFLEPGATYAGFGRFSRSSSLNQHDTELDERGFAFRIITADGPQDFVLANTPTFFTPDPVTFVRVSEVLAKNALLTVPFKLMLALGPQKAFAIALRSLFRTPKRDISFTSQPYWSQTPFQLGSAAVKIAVVPDPKEQVRAVAKGPHFLTEQLKKDLSQGPRKFKAYVQLFVAEEKTPIENASQEWREQDAPLVCIGSLTVTHQDFDAAKADTIENSEAFNPWNTAHLRPLGSLNRARKQAYYLSAKARGAHPLALDQ